MGVGGVTSPNTGLTERCTFIVRGPHGFVVPIQSGVVAGSASGSSAHPKKVEPASGLAVSCTVGELGKTASQVPVQSIPAGDDVTLPEPNPIVNTFSRPSAGGSANSRMAIKKMSTQGANR